MRLGKPEQGVREEYIQENIDGITVYSHNSIQRLSSPMNIDIDLDGSDLATRLVMRGVSNEVHVGIC